MKGKSLIIGLSLLGLITVEALANEKVGLAWVSQCSDWEDLSGSKIIDYTQANKEKGSYCINFKKLKFEPLMGDQLDINEFLPAPANPNQLATEIHLLIDGIDSGYSKEAFLKIKITEKVPVCTECSSSCWELDRINEYEKIIPIVKNSKRQSINLTKVVQDWTLMGIKFKAQLIMGEKVINETFIELNSWGWCA